MPALFLALMTKLILQAMAGTGRLMLYSFIISFLFFALVTFIGNFQEACGIRTGWGAGESAYLWDVSLDVRDPSGHFPHRLSVTPFFHVFNHLEFVMSKMLLYITSPFFLLKHTKREREREREREYM
ncbi:hypothetical protein ACOSQ3_028724 [Xanthoceras sorbifolium]